MAHGMHLGDDSLLQISSLGKETGEEGCARHMVFFIPGEHHARARCNHVRAVRKRGHPAAGGAIPVAAAVTEDLKIMQSQHCYYHGTQCLGSELFLDKPRIWTECM